MKRKYQYKAEGGRVYVKLGPVWRESATAMTADGWDLRAHDIALQKARQQRRRVR